MGRCFYLSSSKIGTSNVRFICRAALIAALYVVFTLISHYAGLTGFVVQLRLSEALCVLPLFTAAAIPGLTLGCIIANLIIGCAPWDIVLGSAATLIGALTAYILCRAIKSGAGVFCRIPNAKRNKAATWLSPFPNVIANTIILPPVIAWLYGATLALPVLALTVLAGELACGAALGIPLAFALSRRAGAWLAD